MADMNQIKRETVKLKKLIAGTLLVDFENVFEYGIRRNFVVDVRQNEIIMPLHFAASLYSIPETYGAFKQGLFTFDKEDLEKIWKIALELGYVYEEEKKERVTAIGTNYTPHEVLTLLKNGRTLDIKKIINEGGRVQRELLAQTAIDNKEKLNISILRIVEEGLNIQILGDE